MQTYIAFIRGINGGLIIKMADFRLLFEELSFKNVKTVLATGNVIFDSSEHDKQTVARKIEHAIERQYSYQAATILYTKSELEELIKADPFRGLVVSTSKSQQVSFTQKDSGKLPFILPYDVPKKGYTILRMMNGVVQCNGSLWSNPP